MKQNNIINFDRKNKQLAEMGNLALGLGKQHNRNLLLDTIEKNYTSMTIITRDIIEAYMVEGFTVASDILYINTKQEVPLDEPVFKSDVVITTEKGYEFTSDGVDELVHLKNINDPLVDKIGLYTTLFTELLAEKERVEKKFKKDLLSEKHLRQLQKQFKEMGIAFDKKEVKHAINKLINEYGVVNLLKNNYVDIATINM